MLDEFEELGLLPSNLILLLALFQDFSSVSVKFT